MKYMQSEFIRKEKELKRAIVVDWIFKTVAIIAVCALWSLIIFRAVEIWSR